MAKTRLIDTLQEEELQEMKEEQKETASVVKKAPVEKIISKDGAKDRSEERRVGKECRSRHRESQITLH